MPTTEQDSMQRSGMETPLCATSPYALFLSPSHQELQRVIEVTFCCFISEKVWVQPIWNQTRIRRTRRGVWFQGHTFSLESRGLPGTTV